MADERIPLLLQTPAAVRFLSIEPLLGAIDIGLLGTVQKSICPSYTLVHEMLHWVIVGGESGPNARAMHPNWARSLRDQCAAAGVAFFFKQWGEWRSICQGDDGWWQYLYKSSRAGRDAKCTVPELGVRNDGQHVSLLSPIAWQQGKDTVHAVKVGKKAAGSLLDGKSHDAYPNEAAQ